MHRVTILMSIAVALVTWSHVDTASAASKRYEDMANKAILEIENIYNEVSAGTPFREFHEQAKNNVSKLKRAKSRGRFTDLELARIEYALGQANAILSENEDNKYARRALKAFERVIELRGSSNDYYLAGAAAFQVNRMRLAYEYWRQCAEFEHAGCMNVMATAYQTGDNGIEIDLDQSIAYHRQVYETGTMFRCAGSFSAAAIARIMFYNKEPRESETALDWIQRARELAIQVSTDLQLPRRLCGVEHLSLAQYFMRRTLGEDDRELLQGIADQTSEPIAAKIAKFVAGDIEENQVLPNGLKGQVSTAADRCTVLNYLSHYMLIQNDAAKAAKYITRMKKLGYACKFFLLYLPNDLDDPLSETRLN